MWACDPGSDVESDLLCWPRAGHAQIPVHTIKTRLNGNDGHFNADTELMNTIGGMIVDTGTTLHYLDVFAWVRGLWCFLFCSASSPCHKS